MPADWANIKQHQCVFGVSKVTAHLPSAFSTWRKVCSRSLTHTQSCEQDKRARNTTRVHTLSVTTTVNILYCSITHVCHTCCLYDNQDLFTHCTHKDVVFCNCLYLKMFCQWLCLYVMCFTNAAERAWCVAAARPVFDAVLLLTNADGLSEAV